MLGVTVPVRFVASGNLTSNTITIYNNVHKFEVLTDAQVGALISSGQFTGSFPLNSINTVTNNTLPKVVETSDYFKSGFVYLFPIVTFISSQTRLGQTI
ncbi:MAG: hypothetical protein ACKPKO_50160, partial [Candidatus Fonsibacter sp.]